VTAQLGYKLISAMSRIVSRILSLSVRHNVVMALFNQRVFNINDNVVSNVNRMIEGSEVN
jgi:hypothetical protein